MHVRVCTRRRENVSKNPTEKCSHRTVGCVWCERFFIRSSRINHLSRAHNLTTDRCHGSITPNARQHWRSRSYLGVGRGRVCRVPSRALRACYTSNRRGIDSVCFSVQPTVRLFEPYSNFFFFFIFYSVHLTVPNVLASDTFFRSEHSVQ